MTVQKIVRVEIGEELEEGNSDAEFWSGSVVALPPPDSSIPSGKSEGSLTEVDTSLFAVQKGAAEIDTPAATDSQHNHHPRSTNSQAFLAIERYCRLNEWADCKKAGLWAKLEDGAYPELRGDLWIEQVLRDLGIDAAEHRDYW